MKRKDLLKKLGYTIPQEAIRKVFIDTDFLNEADDPYALLHYIMSPTIEIMGVGSTHYYKKKAVDGAKESMYSIRQMLDIIDVSDIDVYMGSNVPLDVDNIESTEASERIIELAHDGLIYVVCHGALTNLAIALKKEPEIAKNIIAIVNGSNINKVNRAEFNIYQDIRASQIVFESDAKIILIPQEVYSKVEVPLSMLKFKLNKVGPIGKFLFDLMESCNLSDFNKHFLLRTGENWTLGDNATLAYFLINNYRGLTEEKRGYTFDKNGIIKIIETDKIFTVFKDIDANFILNDFFSKLYLLFRVND